MKNPPPFELGPTVAKAVKGLDNLIQKLEQALERLDGNNRPGSEELAEAIAKAKLIRAQLATEKAYANSKTLTQNILLASSIMKLIDRLLSVIFYFYMFPSYAIPYPLRQHHSAPS